MSRSRARHGHADIHIPAAVITTLGRVAVLGLLGSFVLVLLIVLSPRELDAVTATLVTAFMALGGNSAVALGAILATTRPTSDPTPVTTAPGDVLRTTDVTSGSNPAVTGVDRPVTS